MLYNFDFEGGEFNSYTFKTANNIKYRVKFKPSDYIFGERIWSFYTYELVIEIAENLTNYFFIILLFYACITSTLL